MTKHTLTNSRETVSNNKQPVSVDETVQKMAEMFIEMMPETANFREFEETMLELSNEVVKQTLKKNSR